MDIVTLKRRDEDLDILFKRIYEDSVTGRLSRSILTSLRLTLKRSKKIEIHYKAVGVIEIPDLDECIIAMMKQKDSKMMA